jgi:photosystem II stability/assembly factor-like uncharacterized protein
MTRIRLSFTLLVMGVAFATSAYSQTRLSSNAGEVRDIKYASGDAGTAVFYAATQGGGVFRSTSGGSTWAPTGLNTGYAWKLAVSPLDTSRVYAATDNGLFRTDNAGTNWTQLTFDPAKAVAVDPGSAGNDTVLLGVSGNGVLRSADNGATWTRQSSGLDSADPTHIVYQSSGVAYVILACNYQDLLPPTIEGNWGGVFRASNANAAAGTINWVNFNGGVNAGGGTPLETKCLSAIAANATRVFVGTQDPITGEGGIYRTDGAGWTAPTPGNPTTGYLFGVESIAVDRSNSSIIHGGSVRVGVFTSIDNGVSYGQKVDPTPGGGAGNNPEVWTRIHAIESVPGSANTVIAAIKGAGLQRATNIDQGPTLVNWAAATGLTADRVRGLANHASAAPDTFWMGLANGGVMKSTNAGASWAMFNTGFDFDAFPKDILLSVDAIAADPGNASVALVGTRGGGLLALSGGTAWTHTTVPAITQVGVVDHKPQSLVITSSNVVYYSLFDAPAGGKAGGLLRSSTGPSGLAQTVYPGDIVSCVIPPGAGGSGYRVIQAAGSTAFFLRYDGLPYRSIDNFASNTAPCVTASSTGFERLFFHDIAQNQANPAILVGSTNKGVYRSTDSGVSWARVTLTAPAGFQQVLAGMIYVNSTLFGVSRGGGLYCSADDGATWQAKSLGVLPAVAFREIKVLNGALHIITDGGGVYTGFAATCP